MTHRAFARIGSRIHCRWRRRNCIHHPALSAEMKPLTGRDLTVIRSIQCDQSTETVNITLHKNMGRSPEGPHTQLQESTPNGV
ncbi:hypothetical protein SAMN05446635_1699 [Burkholderia sp. OK233]|nr:hypothetical protein SAMN05446635_1699 [Burkholderia sp. OK233]